MSGILSITKYQDLARFLIALFAMGLFIMTCKSTPATAGSLSSIEVEITAPGWWVAGPFLSGVRESGPDPLELYPRAGDGKTPLLKPGFPSILVPGAEARWRYYEAGEDGELSVDYPEVPEESMELVTDEWGFAGAMTRGVAFTSIYIEDGPVRALASLQNAGGFTLNDAYYPGDPYGFKMGFTPVVLEKGENTLKVGIGYRQKFTLKFMPVEEDLMVLEKSATVPDMVRGERPQVAVGLPVENTTVSWLEITGIELADQTAYGSAMVDPVWIAPLSIYNMPLSLVPVDELPADWEAEEYALPMVIIHSGGEAACELKFRVRDPEQTRKVTFISGMDNSVQYYGLLPPVDHDPASTYGLILSLHGAGVEASGQVGSYKAKDHAFVVAPTNRRRYGFDWQDWGRLDMLEVLTDVMVRHHIDVNRVHLTGHSMGGHGTWYNGFTYPGLWASASPSAGWTTFELYVPMFLRNNVRFGAPRANMLWQLALREENTLVLAENALNLPVYALEGGADDNVPPQQPRMLAGQMQRFGYDITYEEVPGMGHWWGLKDTPFTDCVDNERHNELWRGTVRDPWPKEVVFRTHNYSVNNGAYWVKSVSPQQAYSDCIVRARVTSSGNVVVNTVNAATLALDLAPELFKPGKVNLLIDGQLVVCDTRYEETAYFYQNDGRWRLGRLSVQLPYKLRQTYGPWKQALMSPFTLVFGTSGTSEQTALNLQLARLYAYHWWYRGNGTARIVPDVDWSGEDTGNLVLLGGPECNVVTARIADQLPIGVEQGCVRIGSRLIEGRDLTYKLVYPNPLDGYESLVLVEGGTSVEAMKRLPSVMGVYSGAGFPDWMVWNDEIKLQGLGGVVASGFFDMNWQLDEDLSFYNEDLISRLE